MATTVSKGYKGLGMNGFIATWYAKNTQKNMEAYRRSAQLVADKVSDGERFRSCPWSRLSLNRACQNG